jgi:hypothetical protein
LSGATYAGWAGIIQYNQPILLNNLVYLPAPWHLRRFYLDVAGALGSRL